MTLPRGFNLRTAHGGELSIGRRKDRRPLCSKRPVHIVMRSSLAVGRHSLLYPKNADFIRRLVPKYAKRFHVKVYHFANVSNHLHFAVRVKDRRSFQYFLRVISGMIARKVTGAKKGKPFGRRFWDLLAWTRIIEWGKAYAIVKNYIAKNQKQVGKRNEGYQNLDLPAP